MKYIAYAVLGVFSYFVVGYSLVALNIMALPLFQLGTKVNTNYKIIEKTYDADNVIYNYEWFKERFEAIDAINKKIANTQVSVEAFNTNVGADRSAWTFEDKTESSRLNTIVLGLKNQKEDLVAEYNARAKMSNRSIFQDRLPLFIELN